jgi:NADH-quinone oxidoreductase subunit A
MEPTVWTLAVDLDTYVPIGILVVIAVGFAVGNLVLTHLFGPRKEGPRKDITYESGMDPFGTARRRFNVRFYILAMTFLVFDVEIIFLYPWAVTFAKLAPMSEDARLFLGRIMFFLATSIIAYVYAWRKGVFRWD